MPPISPVCILLDVAAFGAGHVKAQMPCDGEDVLVAAPAHIHADDVIGRQGRRDFHHMGQRVAGFERGDDPFGRAAKLERTYEDIKIYQHTKFKTKQNSV